MTSRSTDVYLAAEHLLTLLECSRWAKDKRSQAHIKIPLRHFQGLEPFHSLPTPGGKDLMHTLQSPDTIFFNPHSDTVTPDLIPEIDISLRRVFRPYHQGF